jgi:hypothetical protein
VALADVVTGPDGDFPVYGEGLQDFALFGPQELSDVVLDPTDGVVGVVAVVGGVQPGLFSL